MYGTVATKRKQNLYLVVHCLYNSYIFSRHDGPGQNMLTKHQEMIMFKKFRGCLCAVLLIISMQYLVT